MADREGLRSWAEAVLREAAKDTPPPGHLHDNWYRYAAIKVAEKSLALLDETLDGEQAT